MKIALTVWEDRISPVFDAATMILLAEVKNGNVLNRRFVPFNPSVSWQLVEILKEMGVSILICGAISKVPAKIISVGGLELIPFISGGTEKILDAYAKGGSITQNFSMPGTGRHSSRQGNKHIYLTQQKEVANMPGRNGTGPGSQGAGTGQGKGRCRSGIGGRAGQGGGSGRSQGRKGGQGFGRGKDKTKKDKSSNTS